MRAISLDRVAWRILALVALLMMGFSMVACSENEAVRKRQAAFAAVADDVLADLYRDPDLVLRMSEPEKVALVRDRLMRLRGLKTDDPFLSEIAEEACRHYERAIDLMESPSPIAGAEYGVGAAALGYMFDYPLMSEIGRDVVSSSAVDSIEWLREADAIFNSIRSLRISLAAHAFESAEDRPGDALFSIGFLEGGPLDYIVLGNTEQREFNDVTIRVCLTGGKGQRYTHAHFVKEWPAGTTLGAFYQSGISGMIRETVAEVQHVEVEILSGSKLIAQGSTNRPTDGWPKP